MLVGGLLAAVASAVNAAPALAITTGGSAPTAPVPLGTGAGVSLTVHGQPWIPTDVIFAVQDSPVITQVEFDAEKNFVHNAIVQLNGWGLFGHGGKVGVYDYSETQTQITRPTGSYPDVLNAADSLLKQGTGSPCIACALGTATYDFTNFTTPGHHRLMVLLTDGNGSDNLYSYQQTAIQDSDAAGITRYAVGVGSSVNLSELNKVATRGTVYAPTVFQLSDSAVVDRMMQSVDFTFGASVTTVTNVQVTATVSDAFTVSNASAATVASVSRGTVSVSGQTVTWKLPSLGDETATLAYIVAPKAGAPCGSIPVNSQVTYTDAQGHAANFDPITVNVTGCASGLTFPEITGTHSYGDAPFPVTATGGAAGTPVTITAAGACTVDTTATGSSTTGTVTLTGAGTCTLTAAQPASADGSYPAGSVTRTFAVVKAAPVVSWTTPTAITYGTSLGDAQLDASATFGGQPLPGTWTYTLADGTDARGHVLNAGPAQPLVATFHPADSANIADATTSTSVDVNPAEQKVTFGAIGSHTYGDAPFTVTATGGRSDSPITFATGSGDTCTLSPATPGTDGDGNRTGSVQVTLTGAGGCALTATQAASADGNYLAGTATTSVSVDRATPDLAWNPPAHITYGTKLGDAQLNAAAAFGGQPVAGTYAYTTAAGDAAGTTPDAGNLLVTATFTPDNTRDFTPVTASRTIIVDKADQTITFPALADHTYGQDPFAAPVTGGASTSPVVLSTQPSAACSVVRTDNGWVVGIVHAGDCDITASQAGDGNFNPAKSVTQTLHIAKAVPALTWPTPAKITYGTRLGDTQLDATANVPGAMTYALDDVPGGATGAMPTAGTHTLHAVFIPADTVDYTAATATVELTVDRATPTLTWPTPDPIVYGVRLDATQLDAQASFGGQVVDGTLAYRLDGGTTDAAGSTPHAGTHTLHATFTPADTANFTGAGAQVSLEVAKAAQAISFDKLPAHTYGDEPFTVTAIGGGSGNPVTFSVGDHAACTLTPQTGTAAGTGAATVTLTGAGECTIVAAQAGNDDYDAAPDTPQSFTVDKATPALAWAMPKPITYGTRVGSDQLNASASFNGQPVVGTFRYALPDGSDPTGTTPNAGPLTVNVTFTPDDTADFTPATAQVILDVRKAEQTITVAQPGDKEIIAAPFNLGATGGGSGNPITYTAAGGACTVDGTGKVTLTAVGTCTITLAQAGNANYDDAAPVTVSFAVTKVSRTLDFPAVADHLVGDVFTLTATGTGASTPVVFTAGPQSVCTVTPAGVMVTTGGGVCTVTATQAGDARYNPSPAVTRTFTVSYAVKVLTDLGKAVNAGATLPIDIELVTANGANVSSSGITVTAVSLDGNPTVPAPGNSQPGQKFALTGNGYRYNVKTTGLAPGTHMLVFTAGGDPVKHSITFTVR